MTIETPPHVKGLSFPGQRHLIDAAMTTGTADPFRYVNAVIEINVVGQIVNAVPLQRAVGGEAFPHRLKRRSIRPNLRVTRHTSVGTRKPGIGRFLNRSVAVPAIDSVLAHVMFVAERHRLIESDVYVSCVSRPVNFPRHPSETAGQDDDAGNDDLGMNVRFWRKQLGHERIRSLTNNKSRGMVV